MSTAMQWWCQQWHQATAEQFDPPQKSLIKLGSFLYFQLLLVFPFPESLRLFRVGYATVAHGGWRQLIVL